MQKAPTLTLRDALSSAFFHRKTILVSLLLPIFLTLLIVPQFPLLYKAEAQFMVLFSREQTGDQNLISTPGAISIDGVRATETEVGILRSSEVIQRMIDEIGADTLFPELSRRRLFGILSPYPKEARAQHAAELAKKRIRVTTLSNSNLVMVSFEHEEREIALEAIRALVDIYLDYRFKIFENARSPFLLKEADRYKKDLQKTERTIAELKTRYGLLDLDQEVLLAANQMDTVLQRIRQLEERRAALRSEVEEGTMILEEMPEFVSSFNEQSNAVGNDIARNRRIELQMERQHVLDNYKSNYPRINAIDKELATLNRIIKKDTTKYKTSRQIRNPSIDFFTNHLLTLQIESKALDKQIAELEKQRTEAQERKSSLLSVTPRIEDLQRLSSVQEANYREYSRRAEAMRLEEEAAQARHANVRVIESAFSSPEGHSMVPSLLAGGVFVGILLAGLCGLTVARSRQVMLSPSEVERRTHLPVIGAFNHFAPLGTGQSSDEMIFLANRLRDVDENGHRLSVIQFVAPSRGAEHRRLISDLAMEVAKGYGHRTLVLNLEQKNTEFYECMVPDGAEEIPLFEPEFAPEGGSEPAKVWQTHYPNLYLSSNAENSVFGDMRLGRPQIQALLDQLKDSFDLILIDVPMLSSNRIGLQYAPLVDGSIVMVRAEATRLATTQYVRDTVLSVGGDILGAILLDRRYYIPKGVLRWL